MTGVLKRIGRVPFRVLVNDDPVELSAVHVKGELGDEPAEFWILDDPANPLALKWSIGGDEQRLQVIRLSYPPAETAVSPDPGGSPGAGGATGGATRIARDLAKEGRAVIYPIYFDFASDRIKEESETVLAEIAAVLGQNPSWSLSVEGHTDNIGGDAYNLDLSRRRSAAVKQALVILSA
jgi:outer membrane protein OmpA-like peptidoglycan-associated protein